MHQPRGLAFPFSQAFAIEPVVRLHGGMEDESKAEQTAGRHTIGECPQPGKLAPKFLQLKLVRPWLRDADQVVALTIFPDNCLSELVELFVALRFDRRKAPQIVHQLSD